MDQARLIDSKTEKDVKLLTLYTLLNLAEKKNWIPISFDLQKAQRFKQRQTQKEKIVYPLYANEKGNVILFFDVKTMDAYSTFSVQERIFEPRTLQNGSCEAIFLDEKGETKKQYVSIKMGIFFAALGLPFDYRLNAMKFPIELIDKQKPLCPENLRIFSVAAPRPKKDLTAKQQVVLLAQQNAHKTPVLIFQDKAMKGPSQRFESSSAAAEFLGVTVGTMSRGFKRLDHSIQLKQKTKVSPAVFVYVRHV
jgi:hypothetical protein